MSKILIVEDEESIAELEKDYLELSGFEVEIENDGRSGLDKALKEDYDLLILDLMLPGTDGFEICKRVREVKNTPIIMVSAKKEDIDKIRGLGLGADDYITKPFSPSEMVARVKAHMARYERLIGSGQPANELIEIRGLKIDKTARRVWVNGEEKTFTTKEFDLLTFLAQNPNHVFTKEELSALCLGIWISQSGHGKLHGQTSGLPLRQITTDSLVSFRRQGPIPFRPFHKSIPLRGCAYPIHHPVIYFNCIGLVYVIYCLEA